MLALVVSLALGPPGLPDAPTRPELPATVTDAPIADDGAAPLVPSTAAQRVADAVALTWAAPSACPASAQVRQGIAELLGESVDVAAATDVRIAATITAVNASYRLDLRIETPSGQTTKEMSALQCRVLVDATALIAAIAIDPSAVLDATQPPEGPPDAAQEPPIEPAERGADDPLEDTEPTEVRVPRGNRPPATPRDPSRVPLVRFALRASGGLDVATLPGVSGGVAGLGAVVLARWRAELTGLVLFPRTGFAAPEAGARLGLFAIGARGCWVPVAGPVELPLCGGAEAGAVRGDPVGSRVAEPVAVRQAWVAGIGTFGVAWAPRPFFALVANAELVVPVLRPGFAIGDALAHRIPPASGRAFLGVEARFP